MEHSTTTWTEFCHFFHSLSPHLVHVVIEWPLITLLDSEQQLRHRVTFDNKIFFLSILALVSEELPDVPCKLNHMKTMIKPCDENISARVNYLFSLLPTRTHLCTCKNPDGKGYDIPVGNNERGLQSELTTNFLILLVS